MEDLPLEGGARSVAGMTIGQGCNQGETSPLYSIDFTRLLRFARNDVQGYTARTLAFVLDNRSSHAHCAMTFPAAN